MKLVKKEKLKGNVTTVQGNQTMGPEGGKKNQLYGEKMIAHKGI